jgi:kumamolisin
MASNRVVIKGSERVAPAQSPLGAADPDQITVVSLYLKRAGAHEPGSLPVQGRDALRRVREANLESLDRILAFAEEHHLKVVQTDAARRLIQLLGRVQDLETAFGTRLKMYPHPSGAFRGRSGPLTAPAAVADAVEAVLGLDERPIATSKSIRIAAAAPEARLPNAVTALYGFPHDAGDGAGQCIAIIELGGGVKDTDTAAAFKAMKLTPPKVVTIAVGSGSNAPGKDPDADGEVALDVQVAGAGAPGAKLAVYFAANTDQGFVDAITQAVHDADNAPSVMSISWGSAENVWTAQAVAAMTSAFQDAAEAGVSVFAASGDGLATDGVNDGQAHVDFPASSPWVVGCGGTRLQTSGDKLTGETVWNSNGGGTGGGISTLFPIPAYQNSVQLPPAVNNLPKAGRGVPDVSADADPDTGYHVVVDGQDQVIGGTSAAAPLWAGLFALVNEVAGKPVGEPHTVLYAHLAAFHDVVSGDNKAGKLGYSAKPGWDACTGLGTPKGAAILRIFEGRAPSIDDSPDP